MNNIKRLKKRIMSGKGDIRADLVLKNAAVLNVFTEKLEENTDVAITEGFVAGIGKYSGKKEIDMTGKVIVPGFVDAHIHLESAAVSPEEFAKAVIPHGTTAVIADPHEITNVCGSRGIDYILKSTETMPLDVFVMVPSCVPATVFDESGEKFENDEIEKYYSEERVLGLAEMMNYPGVVSCFDEVIEKIETANRYGRLIDGHAPGLSGYDLNAYISAGIFSEHEATTEKEAMEKLSRGQWIMIREGTASRNLEALVSLCRPPYSSRCMFSTDDRHPGELINDGEIDHIIRKAISLGADPIACYKIASYNAATYFKLSSKGAVAPGYVADLVVLDDMKSVSVRYVIKDGRIVFDGAGDTLSGVNGLTEWEKSEIDKGLLDAVYDTVNIGEVTEKDFHPEGERKKVIGLVPGQILTTDEGYADKIDVNNDILKLGVVERHHNTGHIGTAYVKGYGLKSGAVATCVAHDSHNIIVVGTNERDMAFAVMNLKRLKGGMTVVENGRVMAELALPVAGLMSDLPAMETQKRMNSVIAAARKAGVGKEIDPLMTLSFVSLSVIPKLRLTTRGVVDVDEFRLVE